MMRLRLFIGIAPLIFHFFLNGPFLEVCFADSYFRAIKDKQPPRETQQIMKEIEDDLQQSQKIVNCELVGKGSSKAIKLIYENQTEAIFKYNQVDYTGGYEAEVAAYELAKYMKIYRVPPTVEVELPDTLDCLKKLNEKEQVNLQLPIKGSAQYLVKGAHDFNLNPHEALPEEVRLLDIMTFNCDRSGQGNVNLIEKDGELFYIDHGLSFMLRRKILQIREQAHMANFCEGNLELMGNINKICPLIDPERMNILKEMNDDEARRILGRSLSEEQLNSFIQRKNQILQVCGPPIQSSHAVDGLGSCSMPAQIPLEVSSLVQNQQNIMEKLKKLQLMRESSRNESDEEADDFKYSSTFYDYD